MELSKSSSMEGRARSLSSATAAVVVGGAAGRLPVIGVVTPPPERGDSPSDIPFGESSSLHSATRAEVGSVQSFWNWNPGGTGTMRRVESSGAPVRRYSLVAASDPTVSNTSFTGAKGPAPPQLQHPDIVMQGSGMGEISIAEAELSNIRRIFNEFDLDQSGTIDVGELQVCLRTVGHFLSLEQVAELIEEVTENPSKRELDFTDFVQVILFWRDTARFRLFEMAGSIHEQHIQAALKAPTFLSDSRWRWVWDVVVFLCAVYCLCITPLFYVDPIRATTIRSTTALVLEGVISLVYLIDVLICSQTSYSTVDRVLVTNSQVILSGYLRSWFILDILVVIPWLVLPFRVGQYLAWLRGLKIFKVMIAGMWISSNRLQMDSQYVTFHYRFLPIFQGVGYFIAFVHSVGAGMLLIDDSISYATAIYYAMYVMSAVGSGDQPVTVNTERKQWFTSAAMISSMIVNGYVVGNIVSYFAISDVDGEKKVKLRETLAVCEFFEIPSALQNEILQFQDYVLQHKLQLVYCELVQGLPSEMKTQLSIYIRMRLLGEHPLFQQAHEGVRVSIAQHLDEVVFCPEEFITLAGEDSMESFFMGYGFADVVSLTGYFFSTLKQFDYFGEQALYRAGQRRVLSTKALTYCDTFSLSREAFQKIIQRYPLFRKLVTQVELERTATAQAQAQLKSFKVFANQLGWSRVPKLPRGAAGDDVTEQNASSSTTHSQGTPLRESQEDDGEDKLEMDDELRGILKSLVMSDSFTLQATALVEGYFSPGTVLDPATLQGHVNESGAIVLDLIVPTPDSLLVEAKQIGGQLSTSRATSSHTLLSGVGSSSGTNTASIKPSLFPLIDTNVLATVGNPGVAISVTGGSESVNGAEKDSVSEAPSARSTRATAAIKSLNRKAIMDKKKELSAANDFLSPNFVHGGFSDQRSHGSNRSRSITFLGIPGQGSRSGSFSSRDDSLGVDRSHTPLSTTHTYMGLPSSRRSSNVSQNNNMMTIPTTNNSRRESIMSSYDFVVPTLGGNMGPPPSSSNLRRINTLTSEGDVSVTQSHMGGGQAQGVRGFNASASNSLFPFGGPSFSGGGAFTAPSAPGQPQQQQQQQQHSTSGALLTLNLPDNTRSTAADLGSAAETATVSPTGSGQYQYSTMGSIQVRAPVLPKGSNPNGATYLQNLFFQNQPLNHPNHSASLEGDSGGESEGGYGSSPSASEYGEGATTGSVSTSGSRFLSRANQNVSFPGLGSNHSGSSSLYGGGRRTKHSNQHPSDAPDASLPKWAKKYISQIEAEMESMAAMLGQAESGAEISDNSGGPLGTRIVSVMNSAISDDSDSGPPPMQNSSTIVLPPLIDGGLQYHGGGDDHAGGGVLSHPSLPAITGGLDTPPQPQILIDRGSDSQTVLADA